MSVCQLAQHSIERADQKIRILGIERHRRPDLHDVVIWPVGAEEDAQLEKAVRDLLRLRPPWLERRAIAYELDSEEQP